MRINRNQINLNFPTELFSGTEDLTVGEFFAGGGGWTAGCEKIPGIRTKWILNHDAVAIRTNAFHHKNVKVYWADVYVQDEHELEPVDHVHASIECTQHSKSNGGRKKKIGSYTMGWELFRYLKYLLPNSISIENVPEFKKWAPVDENDDPIEGKEGEEFERWKQAICNLGYDYIENIRVAADDGIGTIRERFFCFFFRKGLNLSFPEPTHNEHGTDGKQKWKACGPFLDLSDEGHSIFGREYNEMLPKHLRRPLVNNSLKRIAAGVKRYAPGLMEFIATYYGESGSDFRGQTLEAPLATITTANRHQLVQLKNIRLEKLKFIADHCHIDTFQTLEKPLKTQLTWQTKTKVTMDVPQNFLVQYYGQIQTSKLEDPLPTCTTKDRHQLIRLEKIQFITKYFNSNGNPGANIQSIDKPLSTVMTDFKHQLITILDDFDIKARFLRAEELAGCSSFPKDYFKQPGLKLSEKDAVRLIGNAVPPDWATILMSHNLKSMVDYKLKTISHAS